jgi:hypothetical protein
VSLAFMSPLVSFFLSGLDTCAQRSERPVR